MFSQLKSLVIIFIFFTGSLNEVNCDTLDKSHVGRSSIVRQNVDSMKDSVKINPTVPLIPVQIQQQSKTHSISQNNQESIKVNRKGKLLSDFVAGWRIGSLANSAIIPMDAKSTLSSVISSRLPHSSVITTSMDLIRPPASTIGQQFPFGLIVSPDISNIYEQYNPHSVVLSNNDPLTQAVKSMEDFIERFKKQYISRDTPYVESPPISVNTKKATAETFETPNEFNQSDEPSDEVRVVKKFAEPIGVFNCSTFKDIIQQAIKENVVINERRQAGYIDTPVHSTSTTTSETLTASDMVTPSTSTTASVISQIPSTSTTAPVIPQPQSNTTTNNQGYYNGRPQNISGINIVSIPYPATSYGYPNPATPYEYANPIQTYTPPIYPAESFQPHEYYQSEIIGESPSGNFANFGNRYLSIPDQNYNYAPYIGSRNFLRTDDNNVIGGNGFIPSN